MDLFNQELLDSKAKIESVPGLQYLEDFLSKETHNALISKIDASPWSDELKRRVQHYGFKYDYKSRRINLSMKIGDLPGWATEIAQRLWRDGYFVQIPDQLIVNEYRPGQGITPHIDCEPCFEDTIASISLGSYCVMDFTNQVSQDKVPVLLAPRSIVILKDESRYDWKHGIAARKIDVFNDQPITRKRRISLTFRKTILS